MHRLKMTRMRRIDIGHARQNPELSLGLSAISEEEEGNDQVGGDKDEDEVRRSSIVTTTGITHKASLADRVSLIGALLGGIKLATAERTLAQDTQLLSSLSQEDRINALPKFLYNIRVDHDLRTGPNRHNMMANLWNKTLKTYLSPAAAGEDFVFAWHFSPESELVKFLEAFQYPQALLMSQAKYWKALRCFNSVIFSFVDFIFAALLAAHFFSQDQIAYAVVTLSWPVVAMAITAYCSFANNENWKVVLATFFGQKCLIDTIRVVTGFTHHFTSLSMRPVTSMAIGRAIQLAFSCIPQTFSSMLILINELSADAEFRNNIPSIHLITIFASMVCSGYFACMIDMDMDTSEHYRSTETKLFGWVPESRIVRTIFAIFEMIYLGSFLLMRILSMAALAYTLPALLSAWLAAEFIVFTLAKRHFQTYHYYNRSFSPYFSHILNVGAFIIMTFTPILLFRMHFSTVCGRHYTLTVCYSYVGSIAMAVVAALAPSAGTAGLVPIETIVAVASLAIISAAALYAIRRYLINQAFDHLWWSSSNMETHFEEFTWDTYIYTEYGPQLSDSRAYALSIVFPPHVYVNNSRVQAWLEKNCKLSFVEYCISFLS